MSVLIQRFIRSNVDIIALRLSIIFIFALFGTYKWFDFEVEALKPLMSVTWLNVLYTLFGVAGGSYFLGVVENIALIALIAGFFRPIAGVGGALLVIGTGLTTLSLLPQLGKINSFIIKDMMMIGGGLVLLKYDLARLKTQATPDKKTLQPSELIPAGGAQMSELVDRLQKLPECRS